MSDILSLSETNSPASIAANLGFDLFLTKGLKPTILERNLTTVQQDGVKEMLTLSH